MNYILIPLLIILMVMVLVSLVRGIIAFLQSAKEDLERTPEGKATEMQLRQNQMMFARIKYQALAIVVVMVLMMVSR
jgi:hypothetical protein